MAVARVFGMISSNPEEVRVDRHAALLAGNIDEAVEALSWLLAAVV